MRSVPDHKYMTIPKQRDIKITKITDLTNNTIFINSQHWRSWKRSIWVSGSSNFTALHYLPLLLASITVLRVTIIEILTELLIAIQVFGSYTFWIKPMVSRSGYNVTLFTRRGTSTTCRGDWRRPMELCSPRRVMENKIRLAGLQRVAGNKIPLAISMTRRGERHAIGCLPDASWRFHDA